MAATRYTVTSTDADITVPTEPFARKERAAKAAGELADAHPGVTFQVVTSGGKVVHVAIVAPAEEEVTESPAADQAQAPEVVFLVAKRLADYIVRNAADYRPDVVAALQDGIVRRSTGQGHQVHVETTETTAKALRLAFKELHLSLETGVLAKVPFRTTTTARHIRRIDQALAA